MKQKYALVRLRNGAVSVRSLVDDETFHPGIGPVAEAEALYVRQLKLPERVRETDGKFVIWDVGLGAAANALTALKWIRNDLTEQKFVRVISFDQTCDAAEFALQHGAELSYIAGRETALAELVKNHFTNLSDGLLGVEWSLHLGDFPEFLKTQNSKSAVPDAILFDPHSPEKNPAMWTVSLFKNLFGALDPHRPCSLATFTRSTMARAAMLLGGFFVGVGHPSGLKEETTVAANQIELLDEPLDLRWLERAKRSDSAEPLREPIYRRAKISDEAWQKLQRHPQFS